MPPLHRLVFFVLASTVVLTNACGGGNATSGTPSAVTPMGSIQCGAGRENCFGVDPAFNTSPNCDPQAITCIKVGSGNPAAQTSVPITFGQPFKAGDLPAGAALEARDASGAVVPLQMDEVSSHADGSVRFAVLSAHISNLMPNEKRTISFFKKATSSPTAPVAVNTAAFDLKLSATVYSPQISVITFGNRNGTSAGIPFLEGEQITLQLGDTNPEQYVLTVTAAQAGGGHQTLTKIAEAFMALINASSKTYVASKTGEGGGYEKLWLTTIRTDASAFGIKFVYSGAAVLTVANLQTYQPPVSFVANPRPVLDAMVAAGQRPRLNGTVASEYTVVAPFTNTSSGVQHPQLTARLHTRFVDAGQRVRTDMVIENNWTYAPNPGNITYELTVTQGGQTVFHQPTLTHNHHARWHKVLWTGVDPQAQVRHNMRYFLDSKATWNYDLSVQISESVLAAEAANLAKADTKPMGAAFITPYFPTTGGRPDIGPLPRWTALYLVTQDPRTRTSMLANADAAAGIPIHYRDAATNQPVSLETHPGLAMQLGNSDTKDALPVVVNNVTIWSPDAAHQASFAYIPYIVSGDSFYLDEVQFWANWNMGRVDPGYRGRNLGLINPDQMRAQAWSLRSIGEAARALPDSHPMKGYFKTKLNDNLAWYVAHYPRGTSSTVSPLGMMEKNDSVGQTAPWQNDFMALVVGQLAEGGDLQAREYFNWISRFTVGRFLNESNGFCRAQAPAYYIVIRDTAGRFVDDWGVLFKLNWPNITSCDPNRVVDGAPTSAADYAAYARAMLGNASSLGIPGALTAYLYWCSVTTQMNNAMLNNPTWAIVPRRD